MLRKSVTLPSSKSESNRALMIAAYGGFAPEIENLSDSNDTKVLEKALDGCLFRFGSDVGIDTLPPSSVGMTCQHQSNVGQIIDIADCGTAARFMATFLACTEGEWLLTGTERMQQRPMAPLVDALRALGADIQYVDNEGFLPLRIKGNHISGGTVSIDMSLSSQFVSSLLLAAPIWPRGLALTLLGELNSLPYLDMTLVMMRHFGAEAERNGRTIVVKPKPYHPNCFVVAPDWTAASYWYEIAAFSEECEIRLKSLKVPEHRRRAEGSRYLPSSQGDAVIMEWMQPLGVGTFVEGSDLVLRKIPRAKGPLAFDFSLHPDLYPTMAATCAGLGVEAHFTGLDNVRIKESDRVEAMRQELAKIGTRPLRFCAHNDHRIVMALAPLAMLFGPVSFDDPDVVKKSYPNYWNDIGFLLKIEK